MRIELPISKSIANRLLILQAIHRDGLLTVSADMPDDVQLLHNALITLHKTTQDSAILDLHNCGTAMRFLSAYCAQLEERTTILDGVDRMRQRPIGQLVDALREIGAQIEYVGEDGFPPLRITGCALDKHKTVRIDNPLSTQFVSALLLIGANVQTNSTSPYIDITRTITEQYTLALSPYDPLPIVLEKDWSSAAFWYEYVALHGGEIELPGLSKSSLQGDKIVAEIFERLGVQTQYTTEGVIIKPIASASKTLSWDFGNCPDLYPAIALTCERLGVELHATGTKSLVIKESDRLCAVREHRVDADHRMAMALLIAGYPVDDTRCIKKSYPQFMKQWGEIQRSKITFVIPRRGINDEGKGKKHALYRLISEAQTEYVWMQDDDVVFDSSENILSGISIGIKDADLAILPLRMKSTNIHPSLLERLQIAEYAAIQQLTIETANKGKAVMCSGANMIVRRAPWLESYPDLHPEIPSGDDMFLLESFKRRGLKIATLDYPEVEAIVRPETSWSAFFKQRMRWAGKAPKYTDKDIRRCGAIILLANLLQLLCPVVILVKFPIEYHLIKKRDTSVSLFTAFVLEVCYPIYMLVSLVGGLFRRQW